ncbi:MAG: hypothetical protein LKE27_04450 [Atopobiaceae bacterium]|nr:hypothetical protein [Atopobiaceae bacterium]
MPADARSMDVEAEVSHGVVQAEASAYARVLEAMDERALRMPAGGDEGP